MVKCNLLYSNILLKHFHEILRILLFYFKVDVKDADKRAQVKYIHLPSHNQNDKKI